MLFRYCLSVVILFGYCYAKLKESRPDNHNSSAIKSHKRNNQLEMDSIGYLSSLVFTFDYVSDELKIGQGLISEEIMAKLQKMEDLINNLPEYLETTFFNLKLNSYSKVIRKSINALNDYLNNPNVQYRNHFMSSAKDLELSISRILQRLVDYESNREAYLDVLKRNSIGFRRFLASIHDVKDLLKGGIAVLPVYLATTKKTERSKNVRKQLKELLKKADDRIDIISEEIINEDNVPKEMELIMEKNAEKSNKIIADLLYDYLTDKYDTKNWLVIAYDALQGLHDHKLWNFNHHIFRHGGKNAAAISYNRNWHLYPTQKTYLDQIELKFQDYCVRIPKIPAPRDEKCQRRQQPSAEKLGEQLRHNSVVKFDSHFAVIHGGVQVVAHNEIKYYLGPSKKSSSSYTFLVIPGRSAWTESFMIQSAMNSSLVMNRNRENDKITVSLADGGINQMWYMDENGIIRSSIDNYCITSKGYYTGDITVEPCRGDKKQLWTRKGNQIINTELAMPDDGSVICLDVWQNNNGIGSRIFEYRHHGGQHQQWNFVSAKPF